MAVLWDSRDVGLEPNANELKAATSAFWRPSQVGFGPAEPIRPSTDEPIRRQDYQVGRNLLVTPRAEEGRVVTYAQMRSLARIHGILRTVIEKRKDEVKGLEWDVTVRDEYVHQGYEPECRAVRKFLERPDRQSSFDQWLGALMEDLFVIDAPCVYRNMDMLGRLGSLDIVDGATIKVLVDDTGRVPMPPRPAYEQIIKGLPRTWWTRDELIYEPYNAASDGVYGFSHVESIIMTVNIALRRDTTFLEWFRSGNLPQGFIPAPETWTPEQITQFQGMFDTYLSGDLAARSKLHMVPGTGKVELVQQLTFDAMFDEWLARIICARFGVSPAPYVRMMNRATAENIEEASTEESLVPLMQHLKCFIDRVIEEDMKKPFLQFIWTSGQLKYKLADAQMNETMLHNGACTIDDWRKLRGQPPLPDGMGAVPMIWTSSAPVKLSDVVSGKFNPPSGSPEPPGGMQGSPQDQAGGNGNGAGEEVPFGTLSLRAMKSELDTWQTFATRRLGKSAQRPFESKILPNAVMEMLEATLVKCTTPEDVKSVFDIARNNLLRKRTPAADEPMSTLMAEYEAKLRKAVDAANKDFDPSKHPKAGKGPGGGQFQPKGSAGEGAGQESSVGVGNKVPEGTVVYSGVPSQVMESIRRDGLKRGKKWMKRPPSVYFVKNEAEAHKWGWRAAKRLAGEGYTSAPIEFAVVAFVIPTSWKNRMLPDEEIFNGFRIEEDIPPGLIKSIRTYTEGAKAAEIEEGELYYAVVLIVPEEPAVKLNPRHAPAGTEEGGQFLPKTGGATTALENRPNQITDKGPRSTGGQPVRPSSSSSSSGSSSARSERARASYKACTKKYRRKGIKNQVVLAKAIGGKSLPDNEAFDVVKGNNGIEVKTIIRSNTDKLTVHPESGRRKMEYAASHGLKAHMIVFDERTGQLYYQNEVKSYRLKNMKKITMAELEELFK